MTTNSIFQSEKAVATKQAVHRKTLGALECLYSRLRISTKLTICALRIVTKRSQGLLHQPNLRMSSGSIFFEITQTSMNLFQSHNFVVASTGDRNRCVAATVVTGSLIFTFIATIDFRNVNKFNIINPSATSCRTSKDVDTYNLGTSSRKSEFLSNLSIGCSYFVDQGREGGELVIYSETSPNINAASPLRIERKRVVMATSQKNILNNVCLTSIRRRKVDTLVTRVCTCRH